MSRDIMLNDLDVEMSMVSEVSLLTSGMSMAIKVVLLTTGKSMALVVAALASRSGCSVEAVLSSCVGTKTAPIHLHSTRVWVTSGLHNSSGI